jgi:hypothetical protein
MGEQKMAELVMAKPKLVATPIAVVDADTKLVNEFAIALTGTDLELYEAVTRMLDKKQINKEDSAYQRAREKRNQIAKKSFIYTH